jgi:isopentenyldiphosphate isomerase
MNSIVVHPTTNSQFSVLKAFFKEMNIEFSIKKEQKKDDSLFTPKAYFAMLDERVKDVECGKVYRMTQEKEIELFGSVL